MALCNKTQTSVELAHKLVTHKENSEINNQCLLPLVRQLLFNYEKILNSYFLPNLT